jgi:AcrR family transcriptional regulator
LPRRISFSREDIVQAAYAVVEREGLSQLSARRVARQMGGSTAPLYSHFASIDELVREVMTRATWALQEYMRRPLTDRPFLSMGAGVLLFARDHGNLYRALFVEGGRHKDIVDRFLAESAEAMSGDPRFARLPLARRRDLLTRMWVFTHGLASLVTAGLMEDDRPEALIGLLSDVGQAVIGQALERAAADSASQET